MNRLSDLLPRFSPHDSDPRECLLNPFHPLALLCVMVVLFAAAAIHLMTGSGGL